MRLGRAAAERLQGAGLERALPYLLLAPAVLVVLAVLVYPLWDGSRRSTQFYRYGKAARERRPRQLHRRSGATRSSATRSG